MCGIVGIMGNYGQIGRRAFQELLFADTLRGFDSTGIFNASVFGKRSFIKKAAPAPDFLKQKKVDKLVDEHSRAMVGHNRAATKGKVIAINAHPFEFENIMGVHNGTLTRRYKLDDYQDFEVDSENLFYHLQRNGLQHTVDNCEGAYALVWHDAKDNSINMYRNEQRPLHYAYSTDRRTLYWASEGEMLTWILDRNRLAYQEVLELPVDTLLTIPVPHINALLQPNLTEIIPKTSYVVDVWGKMFPKRKKFAPSLKEHTTPLRVVGSNGLREMYERGDEIDFTLDMVQYNMYSQKYFVGSTTDGNDTKVRVFAQQCESLRDSVGDGKTFTGRISKRPTDILTVSPHSVIMIMKQKLYYGYEGISYDYVEYKALVDKGCAWCSSPASVDDKDILWFSKEEHLCEFCQQEDDVKQYISSSV